LLLPGPCTFWMRRPATTNRLPSCENSTERENASVDSGLGEAAWTDGEGVTDNQDGLVLVVLLVIEVAALAPRGEMGRPSSHPAPTC
jgi:hypothetical protein